MATHSGSSPGGGMATHSGSSPGGGMATHSCILAWKIPRTEESGELQSMGFQRFGHDLASKQQVKQKINKCINN